MFGINEVMFGSIRRLLRVFVPRAVAASGAIGLTLIVPVYYGVEESASFFVGVALLYLLSIVGRLGLDVVLLKKNSHQFENKEKIFTAEDVSVFLFVFFSSVAISVLLHFSCVLGFTFLGEWIFWALPAFSMAGLISSYLRGGGFEVWASLVEPGAVSMLAAVLVLVGDVFIITNPEVCFIAASWGLFFINLIFLLRSFRFAWKGGVDLSFFFSGGYQLVAQLSSYLTQWYPVFIFGAMDSRAVVYYSVANRLASVVSFVGVSIDAFAAPRFSSLWHGGKVVELAERRDQFRHMSIWLSLAVYLCVLPITAIYGWSLKYATEFYVLAFLLITCYAVGVSLGPNGYYLIILGRDRLVSVLTVICFFIVFMFSTIFYFFDYAWGIALSVGAAVVFRGLFFRIAANKYQMIGSG